MEFDLKESRRDLMASAETRKMVLAATAAGTEKKAEDTRILELDKSESGFTDFFLIMSGTNARQVVAISDEIELRLKREFGSYPNAVEGRRLGEWVLMDYVDLWSTYSSLRSALTTTSNGCESRRPAWISIN